MVSGKIWREKRRSEETESARLSEKKEVREGEVRRGCCVRISGKQNEGERPSEVVST
jgi:hypothetical protein